VASALVAERLRRVVALQGEVLSDRDPEALHQMRVSFRRLCSTLEQFAPALNLPDAVDPQRIARIRRRLGLTRDLDVLRQRLDQQLLPQLPEREIRQLKPLLKQLKRERQLAFEDLVETLQGRRYLKLLATLQQWLKQPVFTPLGKESLAAWRPELVQAVLGGLTTLPGWWAASPYDSEAITQLHRLRRRLKKARYGLSNLAPLDPQQFEPWVNRFRQLQDLLGDLNDLELIDVALHRQLDGEPDQLVPGLCSLMAERRSCSWQEWQGLAEPLRAAQTRLALNALSHA
jgi:CHAD domain-containing protein